MKTPIALSALCLAFPATAAVNLVVDCSFETNPAEHGGYYHVAGGTSFDGGRWHVTGVDILHVDTDYHAGTNPPIVFNAADGRNSLDLTGTGNSGPDDGVYQDIVTVAGQGYRLSFQVGRATTTGSAGGDYRSAATMRVSIDGGPVRSFVDDQSVTSGIAWLRFSQDFIARGAVTRVAFRNGPGNDYLGLDDVSVIRTAAMPEPSIWSMTILGFAAIGASLRRRRRQAARPAAI